MRSFLLGAALLAAFAMPAAAQIKVQTAPVTEPSTGLSPRDWLGFETSHAALGAYANEPWLMAYNATPSAITIRCDDEADYDLVGSHNYYKNNVTVIPAWSYAPVQVKGWDNYCKGTALKGYATAGVNVYPGLMEKPGDFSHSRWLAILAN